MNRKKNKFTENVKASLNNWSFASKYVKNIMEKGIKIYFKSKKTVLNSFIRKARKKIFSYELDTRIETKNANDPK